MQPMEVIEVSSHSLSRVTENVDMDMAYALTKHPIMSNGVLPPWSGFYATVEKDDVMFMSICQETSFIFGYFDSILIYIH